MYISTRYYDESGKLTSVTIRQKNDKGDVIFDLSVSLDKPASFYRTGRNGYPLIQEIPDIGEFVEAVQMAQEELNVGTNELCKRCHNATVDNENIKLCMCNKCKKEVADLLRIL